MSIKPGQTTHGGPVPDDSRIPRFPSTIEGCFHVPATRTARPRLTNSSPSSTKRKPLPIKEESRSINKFKSISMFLVDGNCGSAFHSGWVVYNSLARTHSSGATNVQIAGRASSLTPTHSPTSSNKRQTKSLDLTIIKTLWRQVVTYQTRSL
jgi:hypothetical protein